MKLTSTGCTKTGNIILLPYRLVVCFLMIPLIFLYIYSFSKMYIGKVLYKEYNDRPSKEFISMLNRYVFNGRYHRNFFWIEVYIAYTLVIPLIYAIFHVALMEA